MPTFPDLVRRLACSLCLVLSVNSGAVSIAQTVHPHAGAQARAAARVVSRHYVDWSATGANSGVAWGDAFVDLQGALAVARNGDEVWVAAGEYRPSTHDATASFVLGNGVRLLGGFAGTEVSAAQRDPVANPTVLSGDIGGDDVIGAGWPTGWNIGTANSGHVVVASGCGHNTVIDGFTIRNGATGPSGTPAGSPLKYGGGLYALGGSPTVRRCTFTHNLAGFGHGGAVFVQDGSPLFDHCLFVENLVQAGGGGAVAVLGVGAPVLRDCEVRGNHAIATSVSAGDGDGAGVLSYASAGLVLERCRFVANIARPFFPVGDEVGYGGGVFAWTGVTVLDCEFSANIATFGAALIAWDDSLVVDSAFTSNWAQPHANDPYPEIGGFGALALYSFAPAELVIEGCTFVANRAKKHAAVVALGTGAEATLQNSIVWDNHATHPEVVGYTREHLGGSWSAEACCIQVVFGPAAQGEDVPDPGDFPGCIDQDPQHVSAPGDLRLGPMSPCVDAGRNQLVPPGNVLDLAGSPRFVDDPGAPDVGQGSGPLVDMGAHERQ